MSGRIAKNENIILRTVHGSVFLIDITDNYSGDKCALYEINETGRFLWEHITGAVTVEDLVRALQEAIIDEVPFEVLYSDVSEFLEDLTEKRFLLEVTANG